MYLLRRIPKYSCIKLNTSQQTHDLWSFSWKIVKDILVLFIDLQPKMTLTSMNICQTLRTFLILLASSNSLSTTILGDFNARSAFRQKNDETTAEGTRLETLTSLHGLHQLISEPSHLPPTSTSCIDLDFTDQPNLVVDNGTYSSLNSKWHIANSILT